MDRRWRRIILLAAAVALVLAFCPTLRYTTCWQFKAVRLGALPPALRLSYRWPGLPMFRFNSSHVGAFIAPSLEDMTRALKTHPRDWRLAAGVAFLAQAAPIPLHPPKNLEIMPDRLQRTAFEQAIAANPKFAPLRGWAAMAYISSAEFSSQPDALAAAEKHLRRAVALEPDNGFYDQLLGCLWLLKKQPDRAIASLEQALNKPHWTTHMADIPALAEHALAKSGADPLTARLLRNAPRPFEWHSFSTLARELGLLAWQAKQAGDHQKAIRMYRVLVGLASKMRQSPIGLYRAAELGSWQKRPDELRSDPRLAALPPDMRGRAAVRLTEHEWYNYLGTHGYSNLAVFAMVEREMADSFYAILPRRPMPDPGPALNWGAHIWAVQTWLTAGLLLLVVALVILWAPRLLPAEIRERVTLALDLKPAVPFVIWGPLIALAVVVFVGFAAMASWTLPLMEQRPELPIACIAVAILLVIIAAVFARALETYRLRADEGGFFSCLVGAARATAQWLTNALLILWLALALPLYTSARIGVVKLAALERAESDIVHVLGPRIAMPPVPGPDSAPQP